MPLTFGSPTADDLRADGWMVAVHNDYRLSGEDYTFWLVTKEFQEDGITRAIRGEGHTDAAALDQIRTEVPSVNRSSDPLCICSKCKQPCPHSTITKDGTCEACW